MLQPTAESMRVLLGGVCNSTLKTIYSPSFVPNGSVVCVLRCYEVVSDELRF